MSGLIDPSDFKSSVVAVPPVALHEDSTVNTEGNLAVAAHIRAGGVQFLLYGGNANLYHYDLEHYAQALDMMEAVAGTGARVITSIGPDFGKAVDQIAILEKTALENVMLLPVAFPFDSHGVGVGVRRIADRLGRGVILYIKREGYIHPVTLERLIDEGAVRFVKYAVECPDPAHDPYLDSLLAVAPPTLIASGMGEEPIANHVGIRGMITFTSGAVCLAPTASQRIHRLLKQGKHSEAAALLPPFRAFERVRAKLGALQVLHEAVSQHVADMGPLIPMVSNVKPQHRLWVSEVVTGLVDAERSACEGAAL